MTRKINILLSVILILSAVGFLYTFVQPRYTATIVSIGRTKTVSSSGKHSRRSHKVVPMVVTFMPFEKITVSEICRRCDINRGTFYLHYTDCFALYERLGRELADRLFSVIRNHNSINNVPAMMESCMNLSPLDQILFHDRRSKCFDHLLTMAREQTVSGWSARSGLKQTELECVFTFIAYSCHAVASSTVFDEVSQNDHIYQLMQKLITNGLYSLVNPE